MGYFKGHLSQTFRLPQKFWWCYDTWMLCGDYTYLQHSCFFIVFLLWKGEGFVCDSKTATWKLHLIYKWKISFLMEKYTLDSKLALFIWIGFHFIYLTDMVVFPLQSLPVVIGPKFCILPILLPSLQKSRSTLGMECPVLFFILEDETSALSVKFRFPSIKSLVQAKSWRVALFFSKYSKQE